MTSQDDFDDWPILQLCTIATPDRQQEVARLVSSVFDLADTPLKLRSKAAMREHRHHCRIDRTDGVTRCTSMQHQDTAEWKEREAARRARQVLPKPPKTARTISKGLQALVGVAA